MRRLKIVGAPITVFSMADDSMKESEGEGDEEDPVRSKRIKVSLSNQEQQRLNKSLWIAAGNGKAEDVRSCLLSGAEVNFQNECRETVLFNASENGHAQIVEILVENNADPNIRNQFGKTSLFIASLCGHVQVVKLLCEHNADPNISSYTKHSPLHETHSVEVAQLLVLHGSSLDAVTTEKNTLLHTASIKGNVELLKYFVGKGLPLESRNNRGETPLHCAGNSEVANYLLSCGTDLCSLSNVGSNALHSACYYGHLDVILCLVEMGLSLESLNNLNQTPVDILKHGGDRVVSGRRRQCIDLLKRQGLFKETDAPGQSLAKVDKAIEEASGRIKVGCILVHGAPQSGKTSVKRLMLNQPPETPQESATRIAGCPVRNIYTTKLMSIDEVLLEEMTEEKMIRLIQSEIRKAVSQRGKKPTTASSSHASCDTQPTLTTTTGATAAVTVAASSCSPTTAAKRKRSKLLHQIAADLNSIAPDAPSIFQVRHLNIVDSGGQPHFTDILPFVFHSQIRHHVVVIRLDEKLHDKPRNHFLINGTSHYFPESLMLTNYQFIEKICQIACGFESHVIVIGTYGDKENPEEPLTKKYEILEPLMRKYKYNLSLTEDEKPIFPVNAIAPEGPERKEQAELFQEILLCTPFLDDEVKDMDGIVVQLRWMVLELELSLRLKEVGILEMEDVKEVAQSLGIDDLPEALDLFTKLAVHYHYPEVFPNQVFSSITPIALQLSAIIEASFPYQLSCSEDLDRQRLQETGMLTRKYLEKISPFLPSNTLYSMDDFIRLLRQLRILFDIDDETFLVPCLLPVERIEAENSFQEPLLCFWITKDYDFIILPQSFFHSLVIRLSKREEIVLNNCKCSRTTFSFEVTTLSGRKCQMLLQDHSFWFSVSTDSYTTYDEHRLILGILRLCVKRVFQQLNLTSFGDFKCGLRCYAFDCDVDFPHPSECTDHTRFVFSCLETGYKWQEKENEKLCWFKVVAAKLQVTHFNRNRPPLHEIVELLEGKAASWFEIGAAFGVDLNFRESLKNEEGYSDEIRIEKVLNEWQTNSARFAITWEMFIKILKEELKYEDVVAQTIDFLQTQFLFSSAN